MLEILHSFKIAKLKSKLFTVKSGKNKTIENEICRFLLCVACVLIRLLVGGLVYLPRMIE